MGVKKFHAYAAVLRIGALVLPVVRDPSRDIRLMLGIRDPSRIHGIWPIRSHLVAWPPPGRLLWRSEITELAGFTVVFERS
jgi:hypothetical protein